MGNHDLQLDDNDDTLIILNNPITNKDIESILDEYVCNEVLIEHRVQEQELLKLKTDNPNFVDSIKETIAKDMARQLVKKISFTKKYDVNIDVHNFRGRAWVFTKEELYELIKKVREDV